MPTVVFLLLLHGWLTGGLSYEPFQAYQAYPALSKRAKASRAAFKATGGLVYISSFLTDEEFEEVVKHS